MPKDSTAVIGEIENPILRDKVKNERDRMRAERALDLANEELKNAEAAVKRLPAVEAELASVRRMLDRPQRLEASLKAPAQAKATVKTPKPLDVLALAISAELTRRMDKTPIAKFLEDVAPGEQNRLVRRYAQKAATDPAYTAQAGWAQELTSTGLGQFFADAAPTALIPQVANVARQLNFNGQNAVSHPRRLRDNLPGEWVGEGRMIPVKSGQFGSAVANRFKLGVIAAVSNEIKRASRPQIVDLVRDAILSDTATALDGYFLDAQPGVSGVRPAGLLFDATSQPAAGTGTIADVFTDLRWLLSGMLSIRARSARILINPLLIAALRMKTTDLGVSPFAADLDKGQLAGIQLIVSDNAPADQVIAVDLDSWMLGIDAPEVDLSEHATIVMSDDPENDVDPTTRSAFQTWETLIRFIQPASWGALREGTVFELTGVSW
ncbi:phage major capsid protein [Shimia aestuarii]|uniref:Phage major capsid protein, HK97 family n=1 Tax=Shimia aestuarii TaxID=254406 RepID=A0A1I4IPM4_9RHOB|nr:phage major capsid protein [Shimia aestuarii]SFL55771.1 phage major capsid protein, HK97 family [Shimia aestuarii]